MYISEEAGKLTTLDRLKKWMDGPEQDLQHPIYPALLMWTQSVLPEVLPASPEVSQTDSSLPYQARFSVRAVHRDFCDTDTTELQT